jgi:hypothetical protein
MTTDTGAFIRELAKHVEPVRPLSSPLARATIWFGLSVPYLLLVTFLLAPPNAFAKLSDQRFVIEQLAALATGLIAAAAAFATTIPGRGRALALLAFVPLGVWMGDLGQACLHDLRTFGLQHWALANHWACLPITILAGALPAVAMAIMLRRGAPLSPRATTALGGLAVAGLANVGARFVHTFDASVIVLAWHVGAVFGLCALMALAGRRLLKWRFTLLSLP